MLTFTGPVKRACPPDHSESRLATASAKRDLSLNSHGAVATPIKDTATAPRRSHLHGSWLGFIPLASTA
jgi:hypothetical protein